MAMTLELSHQPLHPIFIPSCAGTSRHVQLVRKHVPDSDPGSIPAPAGDTNHRRPNNDSPGSQEKCSAGACPQPGVVWGARMTPEPSHQPMHPIFIPWCAGASRHERLVRKHVPDSDPGSIPAPAGDTNHRRPNNDSPGSQEKYSAGACPQPGVGGRGTGAANDPRKPTIRISPATGPLDANISAPAATHRR